MNAYVQFGLAMCVIVLIALFGTAYLAVMFNRRAKADLAAALAPLAELTAGTVDLEEATVSGTYRGHLVFGRMANASEGPGRVFQTDLIDAAGGTSWQWTTTAAKSAAEPPKERWEPKETSVQELLGPPLRGGIATVLDPRQDRGRVEYDAEAGRLRFVRPMRTRRDIPEVADFQRQLDFLVELGPENRRAHGAPDADWTGGGLGHASETGE